MKLQPAAGGTILQAAVFSGDPNGTRRVEQPQTPIPNGTVVSFNGGAFVIAEAGYAVNQAKDAKGPPLALRLEAGTTPATASRTSASTCCGFRSPVPATTGIPLNHTGNWGIYGVADVTLYQTEDAACQPSSASPAVLAIVISMQLYVDAG